MVFMMLTFKLTQMLTLSLTIYIYIIKNFRVDWLNSSMVGGTTGYVMELYPLTLMNYVKKMVPQSLETIGGT